jgi:hypothetical protein
MAQKRRIFAHRRFEAEYAGLSRARGHLLVGGAEDAAVTWEKTPSFFELSLCLSLCLSWQMLSFRYKMAQKRRFITAGDVLGALKRPGREIAKGSYDLALIVGL